jgi:O-antigen/teichoic acid export membrane protein
VTEDARLARRIGRNSVWSTFAYVVDSLMVFTYTLLLARFLGPAGFGMFSAAWGVAIAIFLCVDLGTSLLVIRETAAGSLLRAQYGSIVRVRLAAALTLPFLLAGISYAVRANSEFALAIGFLALGEGLASLTNLSMALLRGKSRVGTVLAITSTERLTIVISLLVIAGQSKPGLSLLAASVGFVAGRLVGLVTALSLSWAEFLRLPRGGGIAAGWLAPYRKAQSLGSFLIVERGTASLIPLLIAWSAGTQTAGIFQAALKIVLVPISLLSALALGLYPIFSELVQARRSQVAPLFILALKSGLVLAAIAVVLIAGVPGFLVQVVFGSQYAAQSGPALRLLAPLVALGAIWQLSLYLLCASGRERLALGASIVTSVASLTLIAVFGKLYGAPGCAIGLVAGSSIGLISYWSRLRELGVGGVATRLLLPPAAGIAAGLVVCRMLSVGLGVAGLIASIILAVTLLPFVAIRFGYITAHERTQLMRLIRS